MVLNQDGAIEKELLLSEEIILQVEGIMQKNCKENSCNLLKAPIE